MNETIRNWGSKVALVGVIAATFFMGVVVFHKAGEAMGVYMIVDHEYHDAATDEHHDVVAAKLDAITAKLHNTSEEVKAISGEVEAMAQPMAEAKANPCGVCQPSASEVNQEKYLGIAVTRLQTENSGLEAKVFGLEADDRLHREEIDLLKAQLLKANARSPTLTKGNTSNDVALQKRAVVLQRQLDASQQQLDALQQQLDASQEQTAALAARNTVLQQIVALLPQTAQQPSTAQLTMDVGPPKPQSGDMVAPRVCARKGVAVDAAEDC